MTEKTFTNIPSEMMRDTTLTPANKLVLGYIYTRSLIKETEWEVVASDIATQCGLSKQMVSLLMKDFIKRGILHYKETRRHGGEWAHKVFSINKDKLNEFIFAKRQSNKVTAAVHKLDRRSPIVRPLAVQGLDLEEENKKKSDNKSIKEEAKIPETLPAQQVPDWATALQSEMKASDKGIVSLGSDYKSNLQRRYK